MAVTNEQKIDFLLKKIGFTKTKTGSVVGTGAISGTPKQPFAEAIPSPLVVPNSSLWNEAGSIPATPPGSDTAQVKVYLAASSGLRMTADATSSNQRAYIAYSTYGNASSTRLTNWIDTQFGSAYLIKVYKGDPNSGGVALSAAGSGANDGWFFDYSAGVLNFNDTSVPSGVTDTNIYIVGYRYIGQTGAPTSGISTFSNLDLTVERNLDVGKQGGISTFRHNVQLLDNDKLQFGDSQDLEIYHDSNHSYIDDTGTGNLKIRSGTIEVSNLAGSKTSAVFNSGSSQDLYFNNTKRFETTNTGINVIGDGVFSGNVSIGGTLTYEDVKNVDAVGLITARSGIRVTGGVIEAQAGENKIPSLYAAMGNLPSAGSYHGMFAHVHATGRGYFAHAGNWLELVNREINGVVGTGTETYNIGNLVSTSSTATSLNVSGVTTTVTLDVNGDLDVDGHTNLDNLSVAGVTTFSDTVHVGTAVTVLGNGNAIFSGITTFNQGINIPFYKSINIGANTHGKIHYPVGGSALEIQALNQIKLKSWDGNSYETAIHIAGVSGQVILGGYNMGNARQPKLNVAGGTIQTITMDSSDGTNLTERFRLSQGGFNFTGLSTHTGNFDLDGDLDVDGHTNLDNVSIAGVTSVASLTSGRVVTAGTGGKLQDSNNLTFDGTNLFVSGINVTGGGSTSTLGADIVTRNFKATGISTFEGNARFNSTITAGGSTGTNGQYLKTTATGVEWASFPTMRTSQTFTASSGQTTFSFSYTIGFLDVFVNGVKLASSEFTATNGTSVVLAVGSFVGDIVELISYYTVSGGGGGGGGGGISNVVEDTTPQLGGNLDLFNKSITGTGNVNITGIISATSFKGPSGVTATFIGDGSGLTNVIGSGSGVVVKDDGNVVGTAGTIDFGQNISVTPISAGIVTVGVTSAHLDINKLTVTGITTFVGITTFNNTVSFRPPIGGKVNFFGSVEGKYMRWQNNGSNVGLYFANYSKLYFGDDSRTQIDPHGNGGSNDHFRIWQYRPDGKENQFQLSSDFINIIGAQYNSHQSRDIAKINYHDGASFYHFGNKKFQTSGVGVTITSQLDVTNINASGVTTTTEVRSNALSLKNAAGSATYATFSNGGAAVLKWNNTDRLETTTSGVTVTGTVAATSYTGDGSQLTGIGAGSTANIITNNLQVLGISTFIGIATFAGEVQTGTGSTVGIGSTAYVHKIAFKDAGSSSSTDTAAIGNQGSYLKFIGGGVQNGVWSNNGLKIAGSGASTLTGPEANCTLEVVSSQNTRVLFKGSANTGLDFDSSSPNNGVANYIRSDKDIIFYTGYGSSGLSTNFKIGEREGSTFYNSVGIRTNYYPLGAVSISMDAISGIVTATKFVGDGSQLTNLPGGGSYGNNDVDNHLNVSGASSGQILSWNGSDYAWVADQTGGGGGTDVGITTNLSGSFTASAGTPATINTFAYHDNDKVVEYTVYIKNGSDFQSQKLLAMRDGTTIHSTQFAVMFSSSLLVQCDATISSGNILLRATPETGVSGSTTYKIKREVM